MERKEELTLLGGSTVYRQDLIIGYVSTALSLQVFVLSPDSLTLLKSV